MLTSVTSAGAPASAGRRQGVRRARITRAARGRAARRARRPRRRSRSRSTASTPASSSARRPRAAQRDQRRRRCGARSPPPWAGRSSPRCRSRRPGCPAVAGGAGGRRAARSAGALRRRRGSTRRRRGAGSAPARRAGSAAPARRASSSMKRQPLARVGGIERHVGAAGLEDGRAAPTTSSGERSRQTPTSVSGPTPSGAQAAGQPVGPRVELARRSARSPSADQRRRRSGRRAPPAPRTARAAQRPAGRRRAGAVPLDQELLPLGGGEQRQLGDRRGPGRRPRPLPAASAKCPSSRSTVARRTGRCCTRRRRRSPPSGSVSDERRGRTWPSRRRDRRARSSVEARRARSAPARRVLAARTCTWKSGDAAEVALGLQLLDQLLERQVLVGVGAERASRAPGASSSPEGRVARQVGAQHQRVDEEADQPLDLRPGCGRRPACRPATSSCPL